MPPSFGKLILTQPGLAEQEFNLAKGQVTLGRAAVNDIVLLDPKASRSHARLECGEAGCEVIDLGSANGVHLNGVRVDRARLNAGDVIGIGDTRFRYEPPAESLSGELTLIDSEAELEATLLDQSVALTLNETGHPRLAVYTPQRTWEIPLVGDALTIGRNPDSDVAIDHARVSRQHARIERRGDGFVLRDLDSANGTWLGPLRIDEHVLGVGDSVRIGNARLTYKPGFEQEELTVVADPLAGAPSARRPVIVVPGLAGSQLYHGSERVWPNVRYLFRHPELFRLPEGDGLEARGVVDEVVIIPNLVKQEQYNRLGDYLVEGLGYQRGFDMLEFAYDWRKDVRESAQQLGALIESWELTTPVTLIAHSLGCLVSRYYVERLGGKRRVERLILLGGPHYGVPKALANLLLGPELLPFGLFGDRIREVLITFPSVYQILPIYPCTEDQHGQPIDIFEDVSWLPERFVPLLREASAFRRELGTKSSVPCVSIFGYGIKTISKLNVQRASDGTWQKVDYTVEKSGDETIPERSTVLEGSEIHPVEQFHGSLYIDNDVKMRLKFELTR